MGPYDPGRVVEDVRQAAVEEGHGIILHFLGLYDDGKISFEVAMMSAAFQYARQNRHNQALLLQQRKMIGLWGHLPPSMFPQRRG